MPSGWLCNWSFVGRSEGDFKEVLAGVIHDKGLTVEPQMERDATGKVMFAVIGRHN